MKLSKEWEMGGKGSGGSRGRGRGRLGEMDVDGYGTVYLMRCNWGS